MSGMYKYPIALPDFSALNNFGMGGINPTMMGPQEGFKLANNPSPGGGMFSNIGTLEGLGALSQGIGALGGIWGAIKSAKLAKEQLEFSKKAFNTNLKNQTQTYNTSLSDRARARFHTEGRAPDELADYIAKNKL